MKIKGLIDESFADYKKPSMYITFPKCSFKCDTINGCPVCQNSRLAQEPDIDITKEKIIERYLDNPITQAIVLSGLEPLDSILDVVSFVEAVRTKYHCNDDIVIYTGYTKKEIETGFYGGVNCAVGIDLWNYLRKFPNIYVKFGRFLLNQKKIEDKVLGVTLASENQYGEKISYDQV